MSAYGSVFHDLPGYVNDDGNAADHERQTGVAPMATPNADVQACLRMSWLMVIGALVLLWVLGYAFK